MKRWARVGNSRRCRVYLGSAGGYEFAIRYFAVLPSSFFNCFSKRSDIQRFNFSGGMARSWQWLGRLQVYMCCLWTNCVYISQTHEVFHKQGPAVSRHFYHHSLDLSNNNLNISTIIFSILVLLIYLENTFTFNIYDKWIIFSLFWINLLSLILVCLFLFREIFYKITVIVLNIYVLRNTSGLIKKSVVT